MYSGTNKSNNAIIRNNKVAEKIGWLGRGEIFSHYKNLTVLL